MMAVMPRFHWFSAWAKYGSGCARQVMRRARAAKKERGCYPLFLYLPEYQKGPLAQWPESQLTAKVEPSVAISRSATTVGALAIALAFDRAGLLVEFARDALETLALERGEVGELACDLPQARAL
jgi:hypothetical protein